VHGQHLSSKVSQQFHFLDDKQGFVEIKIKILPKQKFSVKYKTKVLPYNLWL